MTKEHKVGDTIYVKCTIAQIDGDDHEKPYGIKFVDWDYGTPAWPNRSDIIDELPTAEPVKPVLPKKVADEMDFYKNAKFGLTMYLKDTVLNTTVTKATNKCLYSYLSDKLLQDVQDDRTMALINAWNNGYTVEKPKLYNLILNDDFNGKVICLFKPTGVDGVYASYEKSDINLKHNEKYQFNQEEIDKYNENFMIKNLNLNDYKVEVNEVKE